MSLIPNSPDIVSADSSISAERCKPSNNDRQSFVAAPARNQKYQKERHGNRKKNPDVSPAPPLTDSIDHHQCANNCERNGKKRSEKLLLVLEHCEHQTDCG